MASVSTYITMKFTARCCCRHAQLILQIRRAHELADGWCYKTYAYNVEQCSALQPSGWKPLAVRAYCP